MTIVLDEYLSINGVDFATHNCRGVDVLPFTKYVARGENLLVPLVAGRLETAVVRDEFAETFEARLRGDVDADGVPIADARSGLRALIASLRSSVTGSQTATLHLVGSTTSADVQVTRFDPVTTGPTTARLLMQIVVPAGEFT